MQRYESNLPSKKNTYNFSLLSETNLMNIDSDIKVNKVDIVKILSCNRLFSSNFYFNYENDYYK